MNYVQMGQIQKQMNYLILTENENTAKSTLKAVNTAAKTAATMLNAKWQVTCNRIKSFQDEKTKQLFGKSLGLGITPWILKTKSY